MFSVGHNSHYLFCLVGVFLTKFFIYICDLVWRPSIGPYHKPFHLRDFVLNQCSFIYATIFFKILNHPVVTKCCPTCVTFISISPGHNTPLIPVVRTPPRGLVCPFDSVFLHFAPTVLVSPNFPHWHSSLSVASFLTPSFLRLSFL